MNEELSIICNTLEQLEADAERTGEDYLNIRLKRNDVWEILRYIYSAENNYKKHMEKTLYYIEKECEETIRSNHNEVEFCDGLYRAIDIIEDIKAEKSE